MNFAYVINEFLRSPKVVGLSRSTRYNLKHALAIAQEELGMLAVEQIRPSAVQKFLDKHEAFPGKQTLLRAALRSLEEWAIVRDYLPFPITTGVKAIKSKREGHRPWTDEQIALAIKHSRPHIARAIMLTVETGQRGSDIVRMEWSHLETFKGVLGINVKQRKTGRKLWIPLSVEFAAELATWERRFPPFLILSPEGCTYSREWLSKEWTLQKAKIAELANEDITFHGLRAAKVIKLRLEKKTDSQIANLVGMSVPMVTRYARQADQRQAAYEAMEKPLDNVVRIKGKT